MKDNSKPTVFVQQRKLIMLFIICLDYCSLSEEILLIFKVQFHKNHVKMINLFCLKVCVPI